MSDVVKLRVSEADRARWTAAAAGRDARARKNGGRDRGLSGLVRAAVKTAIKADEARRRRARRARARMATKKDPRRRREQRQRRAWRTLFTRRLTSANGGGA